MSRELIENLREYADIAEAGDKSHWADAMRQAADYIRDDMEKPLPEPLSEDEIIDMYFDGFSIGELLGFARAIEEAHGIGGESGNT